MALSSVPEVEQALRAESYLPDHGLATAIYLALVMRRPLLLEGEPGVGKTEVGEDAGADPRRRADPAPVLRGHRRVAGALRVGLLAPAALRAGAPGRRARRRTRACRSSTGRSSCSSDRCSRRSAPAREAVLLIDELDRADDEFEAFLLEVLSDFSVTVPELGTIGATAPPAVVITSNRTRELHDALKRRCLYHWIDFPDLEREVEIITLRVPGVSEQLARSVATTVMALRGLDLIKPPGAAEAIDWAQALAILGADTAGTARRRARTRSAGRSRTTTTCAGSRRSSQT